MPVDNVGTAVTLNMRGGLFTILMCCFQFLFAQPHSNYSFRHIDQSDGLLHAKVNTIVQDKRGFIWILTDNGLQRYDGSGFVNYPFDVNDPNCVSNTSNLQLFYEENRDRLLLMNWEIEVLDLQKNTTRLLKDDEILKDKSVSLYRFMDSKANRWMVGNFGIFQLDKRSEKMTPLLLRAPALAPYTSHLFFEDSARQEIWMTTWQGLSLFRKKDGVVYTHENNPVHDPLLQAMSKKKLSGCMKDSRQNIWISTGTAEFYKYNTIEKKLSIYSLNNITNIQSTQQGDNTLQIVTCFLEDRAQHVWVGTANAGLLEYSESNDSFTVTPNGDYSKQGLRFNYEILCLFQDKEDNIWIGTDEGINIFNPSRQNTKAIRHEEQERRSLPKNEITSFIQAPGGNILAGTWGGGITVYDSNWNFIKNIVFTGKEEYNQVWSFIQTGDGLIWAGCQHGYIHIYDPNSGKIKTIHPPELEHFTIWSMAKMSNGDILLGLHNGKIALYNKEQKKFYAYDSSNKLQQWFTPVKGLFIDNRQRCWAATESGLKEYDPQLRTFTAVYTPDVNKADAISAYKVEGIEGYDDSTLIIGTVHGGLNYFNVNKRSFTHLNTKDGLPSNTIHAIKKGFDGNIWFTADYELYLFKPGSNKFNRYHLEPGMVNSAFIANKFFLLKDGYWLTATSNELISFHPATELHKHPAAEIAITALKVFGTNLPADSSKIPGNITRLSYKQNFITIDFTALSFYREQQTNYYYQLGTIDKGWVNAGKQKFASYTDLKPGVYTFYVKADTYNGVTPVTQLRFIIDPPYWKKWWFVLLLVVVAGLLIATFVRWRLQSVKAVAAEKHKVQQLNEEQYRNRLELEQIINYFSSSLLDKNTVEAVLWDVAKNLIGRLGFVDCMMYLWNDDKTRMIQRAGYGPKGSIEEIRNRHFDALPGQGVVGYVMEKKEAVIIADTSVDARYRVDEMHRFSEITVPVIYNNELIGVIDSEHPDKSFFTEQHLQVMNTIATLMANRIRSIESEQSLQQAKIEMLGINEKLLEAKLDALRSQMNPHFIFNCLNSIDNLIQDNEKDKATTYLSKFAKLIRSVLQTSNSNTVPCWKDLETLHLYLELEALRFDNSFCYSVDIAREITEGDYKVPPLVIQPFVENAIHHGLLNKIGTDKSLTVSVTANGSSIFYNITDNGVGRKKSELYKQVNKVVHESMGMQIAIDRINFYNGHKDGLVNIIDCYDNNGNAAGTTVEVTLIQH